MNLSALSQNPAVITNTLHSENANVNRKKESELPFASMVSEMIQSVDAQQHVVAGDVQKLASGEADNLQAIAANMAKADLSFRFLMEMRDKLITSYQEVMRMQV